MGLAGWVGGADREHGRSEVITRQAVAATSQVLASQTAAQILGRGGSAVDAAIAANAVLGVVEPAMCGIGGDLFVLMRDGKTGRLVGLNSGGWAPKRLTPEELAKRGMTGMPDLGPLGVTVPGAVRGWEAMHRRYGKLSWATLFEDAIRYAEQGFPLQENMAETWKSKRLEHDPASLIVFRPAGITGQAGELFRNPGLGKALRVIAAEGSGAFYKGAIGQAIVSTLARHGGVMEPADLAEFEPEWVTPLSVEYRGWRVSQLPPNGQGLAALLMLNLMSRFAPDPAGPLAAAEVHRRIEAMKLAYADAAAYIADPRFAPAPVQELLSPSYAAKRAGLINPRKANCGVQAGEPRASDTTYLAIGDQEGNVVSWIQSVYQAWGSGVLVDGYGFHLHNRGSGFTLDRSHPNVLAPRKRPFHTIIPGFLDRGDDFIAFGIMGGANQPLAHAQFVSNYLDHRMNVQAALEAPRFTKSQAGGCDVRIESRMGPATIESLKKLGHQVEVRAAHADVMGRGNVVHWNARTGVFRAASDSRADGAAIPAPLPAGLP
jgi:gamma-glutamyltranspeptidase/glutathione hydrolase